MQPTNRGIATKMVGRWKEGLAPWRRVWLDLKCEAQCMVVFASVKLFEEEHVSTSMNYDKQGHTAFFK